jgi:hypothetical protein
MHPMNFDPRRDIGTGLFGFLAGNLILGIILVAVAAALDALPRALAQSGAMNTGTIFLFCCFPGLANIGVEIYLFIKRRWIALGVLMGLGIAIILASIGMAMLIASGFSLV